MPLSPSQLTALKTDIAANTNTTEYPAGVQTQIKLIPNNPDGNTAIAGWYNGLASPDWYAWRSSVTEEEFVTTSGIDVANGNAVTTWNWTGTGFITRSVGEQEAWGRIFLRGSCNPSLANVRQAFSDILSGGTAPAPANRNHMLVIAKRKTNRVEKLFGTGTGTFASPVNMVYEGTINFQDVEQARAS